MNSEAWDSSPVEISSSDGTPLDDTFGCIAPNIRSHQITNSFTHSKPISWGFLWFWGLFIYFKVYFLPELELKIGRYIRSVSMSHWYRGLPSMNRCCTYIIYLCYIFASPWPCTRICTILVHYLFHAPFLMNLLPMIQLDSHWDVPFLTKSLWPSFACLIQ